MAGPALPTRRRGKIDSCGAAAGPPIRPPLAYARPARPVAHLSEVVVVVACLGLPAGRLVQRLVGSRDSTGGAVDLLAARASLRGAHRLGAAPRLLRAEARLVYAKACGGSPRSHSERALAGIAVRSPLWNGSVERRQRGRNRLESPVCTFVS